MGESNTMKTPETREEAIITQVEETEVTLRASKKHKPKPQEALEDVKLQPTPKPSVPEVKENEATLKSSKKQKPTPEPTVIKVEETEVILKPKPEEAQEEVKIQPTA